MNDRIESVGLIAILVAIWILLPLIPAILLYRLFPDTRVTASGVISNWKVKATGAFGGYMAIFGPGYYPINQGVAMAKAPISCVWRISAVVELMDTNGNIIPPSHLPINVTLQPDIIRTTAQYVEVEIPSSGMDVPGSTITIDVPQFGREVIKLNHPASKHRFTLKDRKIVFTEPIVISQLGGGLGYNDAPNLQPLR